MEDSALFTVVLCAATLATLVTTRIGPDLVLMAALTALSVTGILTPAEALTGFANPGLITVAALFVVAAGVRGAGGVDILVGRILGQPKHYRRALLRLMLPVIAVSGFLNNTPVVATMIPAVSRWARRIDVPVSKLMIPLSYASILGGTLTLIGTSTNLVVDGQYRMLTGAEGFELFDVTPVGLVFAGIGFLFVLLTANWLLPVRMSASEQFADRRAFTFEVAVASDSALVGRSIEEAGLRNLGRTFLAEIERRGSIITAVAPTERLQAGDRLVFVGETDAIVDLLRRDGLVPSESSEPVIEQDVAERRLIEAVVSQECEAVGRTLRDGRFRDRYDAVVLAVSRRGEPLRGNLGSIRLEAGDVLLLEASPAFVARQERTRNFLLVNDTGQSRRDTGRARLAWTLVIAMIGLATSGLTSMLNAALLAAGAMIALRCCTVTEAKRSLDLTVLITIAASFALGAALQKTGAAAAMGSALFTLSGDHPWVLLALTYIAVSVSTEFITNTAAALLMLPIILAAAGAAGFAPEPFVVATMIAASASFATPLGYQTNLMVFGPGGYRFSDFLRVGLPMNCLGAVISILVIPAFFPF